jgi:hypothetical protein
MTCQLRMVYGGQEWQRYSFLGVGGGGRPTPLATFFCLGGWMPECKSCCKRATKCFSPFILWRPVFGWICFSVVFSATFMGTVFWYAIPLPGFSPNQPIKLQLGLSRTTGLLVPQNSISVWREYYVFVGHDIQSGAPSIVRRSEKFVSYPVCTYNSSNL